MKQETSGAKVLSGKGLTVLVVNDSFEMLRMYERDLPDKFGVNVVTAESADEARRILERGGINVLLTDHLMRNPDTYAYEPCGITLAEDSQLPSIVASGGSVPTSRSALVKCCCILEDQTFEPLLQWAFEMARNKSVTTETAQGIANLEWQTRATNEQLHREVSQQTPAPNGFTPHQPDDSRWLKQLEGKAESSENAAPVLKR